MVTQIIFTCFVGLIAVQRSWELKKSERHVKILLDKGGREHNFEHFPYMALLHGVWLMAMVIEVWLLHRELHLVTTIIATILFIAGQAFRLVAMHTLGERWSARIITLPGKAPVSRGIYRYVRHPNYIGVVLEIAAAPMMHGAYVTAIVFSLLNLWMLRVRIAAEEKAVYG